jgi:hypothetical protein
MGMGMGMVTNRDTVIATELSAPLTWASIHS